MCDLVDRIGTALEEDQKVIAANTAAFGALLETLRSMQTTMELLVGQVTVSISQKSDAVPIKVFLVVVGTMALVIAIVLGVNMTDLVNAKNCLP